jgi:replicative DNA helicase
MTDRIPPHNLDYERCILFDALIGHYDETEATVDTLRPEHFYRTGHQVTWQAVCELVKDGEKVEFVSVARRLKDTGRLAEAGGSADLLAILHHHYPSPDHDHAVATTKNLSMMRDMIAAGNAIMRRGFEHGGEYAAALEFAKQQVSGIDACERTDFKSMETLMFEAHDRYGDLVKGKSPGIKTGFLELDSLTGGFSGSLLVIISARPGIGKTAFMLSMARNMARAGAHVGILSLEMDKEALVDRLVSMETGVNSMRLRQFPGPSTDEWPKITDCGDRVKGWKLHIDDSGGLTVHEIRRRCRAIVKAGAQIVFIDQLSKIVTTEGRSEYEKRSHVVNQLAELKKELRIPVVLLAQINRMGEPEPPMLSHLKSTGSLEEDADIVLLGHRRFPYTREPADNHHARWDLAKNRSGALRIMDLYWEPRLTLFQNPPQGQGEK